MYQMQSTTEVKLVNVTNVNWDACIKTIPFRNIVTAMAFSHTGTSLAIVSNSNVTILDTMTGGTTFEVSSGLYWAESVAFSPDDTMLGCSSGSMNESIEVWNVVTSNIVQTFSGHAVTVTSVVFSPCGTMIASGSFDKTVRIWNIFSGCCKCVLKSNSEVTTVCWSGTRDQVVSGSRDGRTRLWDVSQQKSPVVLHAHTDQVTCVSSLPSSFLAASALWDRTLKVFDLRSGVVLRTTSTTGRTDSIQFLKHGDGLKIVYANRNSATTWDFTKDTHVSTIKCSGDKVVTISPDGSLVASIQSHDVKIWSTENGNANSKPVNRQESPTRVLFAPDGRLVASESAYDVEVWDSTSGEYIFNYSPTHFTFSPDSAFFACLSLDQVQVFNVFNNTIRLPVRIGGFNSNIFDFALSPGGSRLVSLSPSSIKLWDLGSGDRLDYFRHDLKFYTGLRIMFSVDGAKVFIKNNIGNIFRIWHISRVESLIPVQDGSHQDGLEVSRPRQRCRYQDRDEWIFDEDGRRILWVPPDWRGSSSDVYDKKVVVGTDKGRRYVVDFSDVLSS